MRGSLAVAGEAEEEAVVLVSRAPTGLLKTSSMAPGPTVALPTEVGEENRSREVRR